MKKYLSHGMGVNSRALMLLLEDEGIEFENVFVNHGGDYPETYEYVIYLKDKGIRFSGKPLGRPPKLTNEEKRLIRTEARLRSRIEGKFGEAKRKYDLDLVKAKTMHTSESWIAAVFFVINLAHWMRLDFLGSFFRAILSRILNDFKELSVSQNRRVLNFGY